MIKTKTLKMRIIYIVAAVAMLAMLIPAMALPVAAAVPPLTMYLVDPITNQPIMVPIPNTNPQEYVQDSGYDITGSIVEITSTIGTPTNWWIQPVAPPAAATAVFVYPSANPGAVPTVRVQGTYGEVNIWATINGQNYSVNKKWGQINETTIDAAQNVPVTWNESIKAYEGSAEISDYVEGVFVNKDGVLSYHAMEGTILNWFLITGFECPKIDLSPAEAGVLLARFDDLVNARFVQFGTVDAPLGTEITTVTGPDGSSSVEIFADGEENVEVVVVPQYPGNPQLVITPEYTTVNFWTREMEVVPQVRWAGEKIVLEKNFFMGQPPEDGGIFFVRFTLTGNSLGHLEGFGNLYTGPGAVNDGQTVDVEIDDNGFASVILYSPVQGDIDVSATLWFVADGEPAIRYDDNQHHFVVYYLKLGSLTLGNVYGKRANHDCGPWIPNNPWDPEGSYADPAVPDVLVETLNVSQDALLRARVTGWFKDAEGETWTLPDDWPLLASPNWKITNLHWDIMNDPSDFNPTVGSLDAGIPCTSDGLYGIGDYYQPYPGPVMVAAADVIGPFQPGIEQPATAADPHGYRVPNIRLDPDRQIQTTVANGDLDWWDAPMPPAKITFLITDPSPSDSTDNAGFFKETDKTDIYYGYYDDPATTAVEAIVIYTNPFYQINVPAHWAIPAFGNNVGYDWDTFGNSSSHEEYGPYPFWTILNYQTEDPLVPSSDPTNYPTLAQVYSDNHGEAMIYLNGDWNLDLETSIEYPGNTNKTSGGAFDIKPGTLVGYTTAQAMADYPYTRQPSASYRAILSNTVVKNWEWGKTIWGVDPTTYPDGQVDPGFAAGDEANSKRMVLEVGTLNLQQWSDPPANTIANPDYLKSSTGEKMAFVWVTDRDGNPTIGERIDWDVQSATTIRISTKTGVGVSNYNNIMGIIGTVNGFLAGTNGVASADRTQGYSYMIGLDPNPNLPDWANQDNALAAIFYKFYNITRDPDGPQPTDFAVAAVILTSSLEEDANLHAIMNEEEGQISRDWNLNWAEIDDPDDPLMLGDANYDGKVNMGDVILAERMMLGLNPVLIGADINRDGTVNIADIIAMERYMLGY